MLMGAYCKSQCSRIAGVAYYTGKTKPGQKRCITCMVQFPYEGFFCPCCSNKIRNMPRYKGKREYSGVRY